MSEKGGQNTEKVPEEPPGEITDNEITDFGVTNEKDPKEPEKKTEMVSYGTLYRYASGADKIRLFIAILAAVGTGASMPLMFIVFGDMTDSFVNLGKYGNCFKLPTKDPLNFNDVYYADISEYPPLGCENDIPINNTLLPDPESHPFMCFNTTKCEKDLNETAFEVMQGLKESGPSDFTDTMLEYTLFYVYFGIGTWICAWVQTTFLMAQSQNQVNVIRRTFFDAILRQDIGFFDTNSAGELNTRLADDIKKISDGTGDKVGITVQSLARFVAGISIAFWKGWKLALVIMAVFPVLIISAGLMFSITTKFTKEELDAYAKAGAIAEEVINSIKTVTSFGGQQVEIKRYEENLIIAKNVGIKKAISTGLSLGVLFFVIYSSYGLGFWYGGKLIVDEGYSIGDVLLVFFAMLTGAFSLSAVGNNIEFFAKARVAAHEIFAIIDRKTPIDALAKDGLKPSMEKITATVSLENIDFTYPARPDHQVLNKVSFEAQEGQTVALCGQSGCGKSTCVQLIQRFYDPQGGAVKIGGYDIRELNVKYLRELIGVVSQEPVLFETSVIENIRYGRLDVSDKEIFEAAKQANAYDFIENLPGKWNSQVGEGGTTLSGGQKQRIAIARALVRNPKILLLDEATSALDTESESIVQSALEKVSKGRTTIVIAHRLSTIRNADKIVGFVTGKVAEEGTHESLLKKENGVYANLCNMQTFDREDSEFNKKKVAKKKIIKKQENTATGDSSEIKEDLPTSPWTKILKMNGPEWPYLVIGTCFSAITGAAQPLFAVIFADLLGIFSQNLPDDELLDEINKKAIAFVILGIINFVGNLGAISCFGKSGEELTMRIRSRAFTIYMSLEMAYFDHPLNSTGALTTRLSTDASRVQGATGARMALITQNFASLVVAFGLAFSYQWQLTLVCTAFVPIMAASGFFMMTLFSGKMAQKEQLAFEKAGKIATEATINIRTVASLAREKTFYERYLESLQLPIQAAKNKQVLYGLAYGSSQAIVFFAYAGCFHFGAFLIEKGILPPEEFNDIYRVLMAIVFGAMAVGQSSAFAPDFGEAKLSAYRMFKLFERESEIDPNSIDGEKPNSCKGTVGFKDVHFQYPTRPDVNVLKGLSVHVEPGQTLALVGQSGCGKSTCIQLIQRFYDGSAGDVTIDGKRVDKLNLKWVRKQIGFVQQEPVLFDKTIEENILYGLEEDIIFGSTNPAFSDGEKVKNNKVTPSLDIQKRMENAAKAANAYDFIKALPSGFQTNCGKKGSQLSGGQKQRIAIARALIREPKILLLDEATSALDAESEKIVQDALDRAREGRTCILIAHRLSTVISADKIAVVDNGQIVEVGTHKELIAQRGAYFSLVNSQL